MISRRKSIGIGAGLFATGFSMICGGLVYSMPNLSYDSGTDNSAQSFRRVGRVVEGEIPTREAIDDPEKYVTLGRLYDEMAEDSELMAEVETLDSEDESRRNLGVSATLVGGIAIAVGVSFLGPNRGREEDE